MRLILSLMVCAPLVFYSCGCAKKHRPLEEIDADKRELPTLYLTEESLKRVMAPSNKGVHVHEATSEICYQPHECTHPDCPGREGDENFLFVHRDVLISVGDDGQILYGTPPAGVDYKTYVESKGGHMTPTCPKCLETRSPDAESDEKKAEYQSSVRPYELPETVKRRAELEEEYQQAYEARQQLREGG